MGLIHKIKHTFWAQFSRWTKATSVLLFSVWAVAALVGYEKWEDRKELQRLAELENPAMVYYNEPMPVLNHGDGTFSMYVNQEKFTESGFEATTFIGGCGSGQWQALFETRGRGTPKGAYVGETPRREMPGWVTDGNYQLQVAISFPDAAEGQGRSSEFETQCFEYERP